MKIKKLILLLLSLPLLFACQKNCPYYDIEGPQLIFYDWIGDRFLLQFNEPVCRLGFNDQKQSFTIDFPRTNFYFTANQLQTSDKLIHLICHDSSGNYSRVSFPPPVINHCPAYLVFDQIRLRYSPKKTQYILIKTLKEGSTRGIKIIFYIKGKEKIIPVCENNVQCNQVIRLNIVNKPSRKNRIDFNKKSTILSFKYRLSQNYSLIYIIDMKNKINDYFFYYNSKKINYDRLIKQKNFKKMDKKLNYYLNNPKLVDVQGNTLKKIIIKKNSHYCLENIH